VKLGKPVMEKPVAHQQPCGQILIAIGIFITILEHLATGFEIRGITK